MSDGAAVNFTATILARGNVAVILKSSTAEDKVVKVQYTSSGAETSIHPAEADMNRLLWATLAESNISMHVCQPSGVVTTAGGHAGLEMERLRGVAPHILNLEQLIAHAGKGAVDTAEFPNLLRCLLFQTVFTLSACTHVFNGLFRHNDLHLRNVCFTPWNDAVAPVTAMYSLRCFPHSRDGEFVDRHFLLHTAYRAVIIDFGWSALLPPLGPPRDPRFFDAGTATSAARGDGKPAMVDVLRSDVRFKDSGMSQQLPCQQYDLALFFYSLAALCAETAAVAGCPPAVKEELAAFLAFYDAYYAGVPMVAGRLPLSVQHHLQKSRKTRCGVVVPTAERLLKSDYFACLRCTGDARAAVAFGVPHARTVAPNGVQGDSLLAGKGDWTLVEDRWGPPTAPLSSLVATVYDNICKWAGVRSRRLYLEEESQWVDVPTAAPTGVRRRSGKWKDALCVSPKSCLGMAHTETVVARSPRSGVHFPKTIKIYS